VFSLQRLLGHTTLEMTRHYCEIADVDVKRAHQTASPVDNLELDRRRHLTLPRFIGQQQLESSRYFQ
jgi:hypothetical protein